MGSQHPFHTKKGGGNITVLPLYFPKGVVGGAGSLDLSYSSRLLIFSHRVTLGVGVSGGVVSEVLKYDLQAEEGLVLTKKKKNLHERSSLANYLANASKNGSAGFSVEPRQRQSELLIQSPYGGQRMEPKPPAPSDRGRHSSACKWASS